MAERKYIIVRDDRAGVFAGELVERNGREITLANARRIWYWAGAASLSQLAMSGTSKPDKCKFPEVVSRVTLHCVIEDMDVTSVARQSIEGVPVWKE